MKKGIHPEYVECNVKCACGATFTTKSNQPNHSVEVCSECHQFYTGKEGKHKRSSNIEKFNNKFNLNK